MTEGEQILDKPNKEFAEELFKVYGQMMFKIAFGILHNKADSEDVVQDAFLWIINNLEKISQIPCCKRAVYFANIIEHLSINVVNRQKRHPLEDIEEYNEISSGYSVENEADSIFLINEIKFAISGLSDRDYRIMYLYLIEQMKPKEIAEKLDIREKHIHTYIERAKKRLAKKLNERGIYYDF